MTTFATLAVAAVLIEVTGAQAQSTSAPAAVVELFTSQGCSSCPAADKLLKTYTDQPGVLAFSFSVDYWDHLGWKDTLASPKNTARQRAYAKALGTGNVYTPQAVIGGSIQAIGSQKAELDKAIAQVRADKSRLAVEIVVANDGKRMTIDVGAGSAQPAAATVWLAVVSPRVEVEVKRGENRGKTLAYHNVVREISPVGMWSGKAMRIELPASAVTEPGARCAVLVQAGDGGKILGAWMAH